MPYFPAQPGRDRLGFVDAVRRSFGFLTSEFEFNIVSQTPTMVRFEGDHVVVQVFHGRSSYILDVEVGLKTLSQSREVRYSLRQLVTLCKDLDDVKYGEFQISSVEKLPAIVERLAELIRRVAVKRWKEIKRPLSAWPSSSTVRVRC